MPPKKKLGPLIGAIDQGTSSTRFLVFAASTGEVITYHQVEVGKVYPNEGWVEQDPLEIFETVLRTMAEVDKKLTDMDIESEGIQAIGVCNQRESTIVWDKLTGQPLYNSIVWLDNRTTSIVDGFLDGIPGRDINFHKVKTGLPISTYFSAFKLKWLIDNVPEVRQAMEEKRLMFGTVDSWLLYKLTGQHVTDVTNACRTFLFDIDMLKWDKELCKMFGVPMEILPKILPSGALFGEIVEGPFTGIPIAGVIGDQSAALVGQHCFSLGSTKATFGTGCFILQNIGAGTVQAALRGVPKEARKSLITTIGYQLQDRPVTYALEGSVAIAGAAFTWLRDNIELIGNYKDIESIAREVPHSAGVFFVPAFQGLYAPYWDPNASGMLIGLSQFTRRAHLIRATLEAIAFQTNDILSLMRRDATGMMVDGGMSVNDLMCQILSDITGIEIIRPQTIEATALGAAMVAGNTIGVWNIDESPTSYEAGTARERSGSIFNDFTSTLKRMSLHSTHHYPKDSESFEPEIDREYRTERVQGWRLAVQRSMKWTKIRKQEEKRVDYRRRSTLPIGLYFLSSFGMLLLSHYL
ncbi:Glycerol kinase 3 [Halotydeus destructor]|nr:Glycerol kinase 3 [Halotydeus destructor]